MTATETTAESLSRSPERRNNTSADRTPTGEVIDTLLSRLKAQDTAVENQVTGREMTELRGPQAQQLPPGVFPSATELLANFGTTARDTASRFVDTIKTFQPALRGNATVDEAHAFFNGTIKSKPVDLGAMCEQKPVCSIGEIHSSLAAKSLVADQISRLAQAGYTQIGFEMIKSNHSAVLSNYLAGRTDAKELIDSTLFGAFNWGPGVPEHYVKMMDAIKKYNDNQTRTGPAIKVFGIDRISTSDELGRDRKPTFDERNEYWANVISSVIKANPAECVLTYSGLGHLGHGVPNISTLNGDLSKLGIESTTIALSTFSNRREEPYLPAEKAAEGARLAGITQATP